MAEIKWGWYTNHWTIHWNPHPPSSWDSWVMTPMPKLKPERPPKVNQEAQLLPRKIKSGKASVNQTWIFSFKMLVFRGVVNHWITQKYYRLYRLRPRKIAPNCPKGNKFSSSNHPFAVASCWFQGELVLWVSLSWAFWKLDFLFSKKIPLWPKSFSSTCWSKGGRPPNLLLSEISSIANSGGKPNFEISQKTSKPRNASCRPTDTSSGSLTPNFWWRAKHKPKKAHHGPVDHSLGAAHRGSQRPSSKQSSWRLYEYKAHQQ